MNYLNASIIEIKYEYILSFYRQIYIKHDDIPKLPRALLVNMNETQFRVFYTDSTMTCYNRKLTGHTSMSCHNKIIKEQKFH